MHLKMRKGQSAIEYLTTYGWALLAILVVGLAITQMGVLDQCQRLNPDLGAGSHAIVETWTWSADSEVSLGINAPRDTITVNEVNMTAEDGTVDTVNPGQQVNQGQTETITITLSNVDAGQCVTRDIVIDYTIDATGQDGIVRSDRPLQGTAP